ncbi:MAG TPA: hypothetical protein VHA75_12645 [Rugosimonospora sp.]|nr:hypothetical protein [Rugosimonospora sp.]
MSAILSRQQLVDAILPLLVDAGWEELPGGTSRDMYLARKGSLWMECGHGSVHVDVRDPDGWGAQTLFAEVETVEQAIGHLRVAGFLPPGPGGVS